MSFEVPKAELMGQVVGTVLEEAAFAFSEPAEPGALASRSGWMARIEFRARVVGELRLTLTHELACQLCASLLGLEPDDEESQRRARDTTGELTNILAGSLLSAWLGEEAEYELGTPVVVPHPPTGEAVHSPTSARVCVTRVTDEGEPFEVELRLAEGS
jgi:CheY-specific phosphatase CheX